MHETLIILFPICNIRYHVPRSWLKPSKNLLIIFEEIGGDISKISLVKRSVKTVCAKVSDNWHTESIGEQEELTKPNISLHCTDGYSVSTIKFASFGTPTGSCGSFQHGSCHAPSSLAVLEKVFSLLPKLFNSHSLRLGFPDLSSSKLVIKIVIHSRNHLQFGF